MALGYFSMTTSDIFVAAKLATRNSANQILKAWIYVPIGIIAILATTFGVDRLLRLGAVSFPASVACLVILFLGLLVLERIIGEQRTRRVVAVIEIPGGWSLRWINVFFTPSFILLPLSPSIGGIEVLKIIAVFVIGFLVTMALAAYMTRGLQLVLGSSKRALVERAEELQTETEEMPMTTISRSINTHNTINTPEATSLVEEVAELQHPPRSRDSLPTRRDSRESSPGAEDSRADFPPQVPLPPARATRWALAMASRLDMIIYASLFTFIGIPVYYTVGYAMPLQLTFSIMVYFAATSLPPNWKTYLHPVLVSSLFTVLGLWVLGLAKGHSLETTLREFRTGATYLRLWDASNSNSSNGGGGGATTTTTTTTRKLPGAGDVFASALDAGIASLALPMYRYRRELRSHLLAIAVPNVAVSVGSLFAYPPLCAALGISAPRGLAFTVRSLTLALALPAAANLGADANTAAALPIAGGIIGALVGPRMLVWLGIPDDDYVTRGVTLGANSSAIATALLLRTDPRAAALSSLSMSLLGTVTVLFTSIPPIVVVIRSLVAL